MSPAVPRQQYAALPWRRIETVEIMLITSRQTRRWIIPKGWHIAELLPHEVAAREAFEEAGIEGEISTAAFGSYHYEKRLKSGETILCNVGVFPFRVTVQRDDWPERRERTTRWFSSEEAARIAEPGLSDLIRRFAG